MKVQVWKTQQQTLQQIRKLQFKWETHLDRGQGLNLKAAEMDGRT